MIHIVKHFIVEINKGFPSEKADNVARNYKHANRRLDDRFQQSSPWVLIYFTSFGAFDTESLQIESRVVTWKLI